MSGTAGPRLGGRRRWLLVLVAATLGAIVFAAVASGLLGGSDDRGRPPAGQGSSRVPTQPSAEPNPSAAPVRSRVAPLEKSVPTRLRIPAIGVDTDLMALGLEPDGALETPPGAFPAGWFTGAPTPGELGPAIIVGHVRYETPGVFARLTELRRTDEIRVRRRDGSTATFRVTRVQHFAKSAFPTQRVYGNIDHPGLRLITCGGLDADTNEFDENVVVFADLVDS